MSSNYVEVEDELNRHRILFSNSEELIISVHSWNVNGSKHHTEKLDITEWLFPCLNEAHAPDIFLVGLEEVVDLNAANIVFNSNSKNIELWHNLLLSNLNKVEK